MSDKMDFIYLFSFVCVFANSRVVSGAGFRLHVDVTDDGNYVVAFVNAIYLESAPPFFIIDGTRYSTADQTLKLVKVTNGTGTTPNFGAWNSRDIHYTAGTTNIIASARNYAYGVVTFMVEYVDGANGTAAPDFNQIICGFPGFKIGSIRDLGFLTFAGHYTGDTDKSIGKWDKSANIPDGIKGSGPLAVFDHDARTIVITPLDNYMASSMWKDKTNGYIYWGIMGGVDEIPVNFHYQVMINYNVGDYYSKAPETGKTYKDTILDLQNEATTKTKLPYKYFELDKWWCIKTDNKVKYWIADPTALPDGMISLENATGLQFLMYSGIWSSDNVYAKQNKGKYNFIIEGDTALPNDPMFWDDLFKNAGEWGLTTYLQDGMDETFMNLNATKTGLFLASSWLNMMGQAASRYNISILYSDGYPRHAYQSLLIPAVTQARVSVGYGTNKDQWKIGISSIFADALKLAPNKDSFRTSHNSGGFEEPYPELQQVVALLSKGVVGNGDGLGFVNSTILNMCCSPDGKILHPMHPAKAIDAQILQLAFADGSGPDGEVWSTMTDVSSVGMTNIRYGIVFAAGLTKPFVITPKNTHFEYEQHAFPPSKIYRWNQPTQLYDFNVDGTFTLDNCTLENFCLYYTAPIIEFDGQEVVILGEINKWIHMPYQRVNQIAKVALTLTIDINGVPGEEV